MRPTQVVSSFNSSLVLLKATMPPYISPAVQCFNSSLVLLKGAYDKRDTLWEIGFNSSLVLLKGEDAHARHSDMVLFQFQPGSIKRGFTRLASVTALLLSCFNSSLVLLKERTPRTWKSLFIGFNSSLVLLKADFMLWPPAPGHGPRFNSSLVLLKVNAWAKILPYLCTSFNSSLVLLKGVLA